MKKKIKEIFKYVIMFSLIISVKCIVVDVANVQGISMKPTLNNNSPSDRVIMLRTSKITKDYKRGEIVVFKPYESSKELYIKRIIALPLDKVEISNGKVYVNNNLLNENYLSEFTVTEPQMKLVVPKGELFVLGDNRENSKDSRSIGTISKNKIIGEAVFRFNLFKLSLNKLEN
ncbi:signal peptidase I [Haloimpatiens sp. FM7315]|uniref:signal peptidase I n=1 Tax=Haloimpatiens sp. FM7315 TaxID=3298609 RepID=UPI0035A27228